MFKPVTRSLGLVITAFLVALGLAASAVAVTAQGMDATPSDSRSASDAGAYPAHIHEGTCSELGSIVFPLSDVMRAGADVPIEATPVEGVPTAGVAVDGTPPAMEGAGEGSVIAGSVTIVEEASLEEILSEEHAINIHESVEDIQNYIACGEITGEPTDGELDVELMEMNNSGYDGSAYLFDNGDGTTTVTIELMAGESDMTGTPEASPEN